MRHLKRTAKLGRTSGHRNRMLANLVNSLIKHRRITTTLAKAKAAQRVAERMVTLGKRGNAAVSAAGSGDDEGKARQLAENVHCRRLAAARLHEQGRSLFPSKEARLKWRENEDVVRILFEKIAPAFKDRAGGYTRIVKLATVRRGDAAQRAILEWVDLPVAAAGSTAPAVGTKPKTDETPKG